MFKFIHVFIVVALMGVSGSNQAFARESKASKANQKANCLTHPESCPPPKSAGAARVSGKIVKGISDVHEQYEKPVHRNGPCDSHMGGCNDYQR